MPIGIEVTHTQPKEYRERRNSYILPYSEIGLALGKGGEEVPKKEKALKKMIDDYVNDSLEEFLPSKHYIRVKNNVVLRLRVGDQGEPVYELFLEQKNVEMGKGKTLYTPIRHEMADVRYGVELSDIGNAIYKALWEEKPTFEE